MPALVVGILNLTPDSFSDGGLFGSVEDAVLAGLRMAEEGADWIDVGGESTRPGAVAVAEHEEIARVVPAIEQLRGRLPGHVRIAIDTYKSGTARAALAAGATIINDVAGATLDPSILSVAAQKRAAIVLGHLRGVPATMMADAHYDDVIAEVAVELADRIAAARRAGCQEIWCDPGIGFSKVGVHNLRLLRELRTLRSRLGVPMMVGVSRKRFIGDLTGQPARSRMFGTAAAVAAAVFGGADAVRVHDVKEMREVVQVADAIANAGGVS